MNEVIGTIDKYFAIREVNTEIEIPVSTREKIVESLEKGMKDLMIDNFQYRKLSPNEMIRLKGILDGIGMVCYLVDEGILKEVS